MSGAKVNDKVIKFLSDPKTYGVKTAVNIIQTHASYVFIAGKFVYKLKKPVNFGFLDYSTLTKRENYCNKEVELNSRFSNTYLGVLAISEMDNKLTFSDKGKIADYVVKMKRIADRYFMKNVLRKGLISNKDINSIVKTLCAFYNSQQTNNYSGNYFNHDSISRILKQNRELASKYIGNAVSRITFDTINIYNRRFLRVNKKLIQKRILDRFVKDCHGDLHLEHVIIKKDKIELFDCIEFNDSFRFIDYVCDIAFLSMDLDYNNSFELSSYFVNSIIDKMKDKDGLNLIDFYKCYRSYVRGKVESIRAEDKDILNEGKIESFNKAKKYFQLSLRYALFGSDPVIIVVFGIIGSGKTTFANRLSEELGCRVISSDIVRKKLVSIEPTEKGDTGIYTKSMTDKTYNKIFRSAKEEIRQRNIVILDASFSDKKYRESVWKKSEKWKSKIYFIEVKAKEIDIKQRLLARESKPSISDARFDLLKRFKANYDKPVEIPKGMLFKTNPGKNIEENVRTLFKEIVNLN